MSKAFRIVLMVCAIILVVAISGSMIYYFAFAKPGNERAKWEAELEWEKEKKRAEELKEKQEKGEEALVEYQLYQCLDDANERYLAKWDSEVKRLNRTDNTLPPGIAKHLNEEHQKQKEECFKLYGPD